MDTKQLITEAKARFNHNSAKAYLKDKYESKLSVASQGGLWNADAQTIALLSSLTGISAVAIDTFGNPVMVYREKLLDTVVTTYETVMADWHTEWADLEKKR
jgi:hypothetical protein